MFLIQIVPRLPPVIDGIGDHALRLAERLRTDHAIHSGFVVADPKWNGNASISGFPIVRLQRRSQVDLELSLSKGFEACCFAKCTSGILLQYAPYGYERRGCPRWLAQGLLDYGRRSRVPVLLMLHELDAAGTGPLNSAFWLSSLQRRIIKALISGSAEIFTNTAFHRNRLRHWNTGGTISLLPSFSTIGEPNASKPAANRSKQLVVFGRSPQRKMAYEEGALDLEAACAIVSAQMIIDIGRPLDGRRPSRIRDVPIIYKGVLDAIDVSTLMENSLGSFVRYPEALLTKSSIYAASCAHGTIPFVSSDSEGLLRQTELSEGRDYVSLREEKSLSDSDVGILSATVFERYQTRGTSAAASQIAAALRRRSHEGDKHPTIAL